MSNPIQNPKSKIQNTLTVEERQFIVQCLQQLPMQGKPAGLRRVLALIEGIVAKLEVVEDSEGERPG